MFDINSRSTNGYLLKFRDFEDLGHSPAVTGDITFVRKLFQLRRFYHRGVVSDELKIFEEYSERIVDTIKER